MTASGSDAAAEAESTLRVVHQDVSRRFDLESVGLRAVDIGQDIDTWQSFGISADSRFFPPGRHSGRDKEHNVDGHVVLAVSQNTG